MEKWELDADTIRHKWVPDNTKPQHLPPPLSFVGCLVSKALALSQDSLASGPSWPACILIGYVHPVPVLNILHVISRCNKLELFGKAG